jgi:hypothetical protein
MAADMAEVHGACLATAEAAAGIVAVRTVRRATVVAAIHPAAEAATPVVVEVIRVVAEEAIPAAGTLAGAAIIRQ